MTASTRGFIALFVLLAFTRVPDSAAQGRSLSLDEIEQLQSMRKAAEETKGFAAAFEQMIAAKKTQCFKAIGNFDFCECIVEKSPSGINFVQYVAIASSAKEELQYDSRSDMDKQIIDGARKARDLCVTSAASGVPQGQ